METQKDTAIMSVSKEIIEEEILPWLPVKSLMRFRCVSKSWRSLIGSERFVKIHFKNSTKNTSSARHRVIFAYYSDEESRLKQHSLHTLLKEPSIDPSSLSDDPIIYESYVVGCCNGLLLCICNDERGRYILWNPATRISFELPETRRVINNCGFGYDAASDAYKVFVVTVDNERAGVVYSSMVYSSKTNSWRTILGSMKDKDVLSQHLWLSNSKFVCGKIHWLGHDSISFFDLESEALGVIKYPCSRVWMGEDDRKWLGEIKGCLSLVFDERLELDFWIMKDYGVKESWLKVLNVPLHVRPSFSFLTLFEIVLEGVVLVMCGLDFVALNRDDAALCSPKKFTRCFELWAMWQDMCRRSYGFRHFYIESLVSPVPEANHSTV